MTQELRARDNHTSLSCNKLGCLLLIGTPILVLNLRLT